MVGRRLEAALSVSNHVKSQSCDVFVRMGKLDAREKKALSSLFLCFAWIWGGRGLFSGFKEIFMRTEYSLYRLKTGGGHGAWRDYRVSRTYVTTFWKVLHVYYCVNIILETLYLRSARRLTLDTPYSLVVYPRTWGTAAASEKHASLRPWHVIWLLE